MFQQPSKSRYIYFSQRLDHWWQVLDEMDQLLSLYADGFTKSTSVAWLMRDDPMDQWDEKCGRGKYSGKV